MLQIKGGRIWYLLCSMQDTIFIEDHNYCLDRCFFNLHISYCRLTIFRRSLDAEMKSSARQGVSLQTKKEEKNVCRNFYEGITDLKYEPRKVRHICHERGQEHDRCLVQFYQLYIGLVETHAKSFLFRAKVENVVFCE